jgi:hypothetical protein
MLNRVCSVLMNLVVVSRLVVTATAAGCGSGGNPTGPSGGTTSATGGTISLGG